MDNGDCEGIGSIIGLRNGFKFEMNADHFLDLGFVGHTVAADGVFDLIGAVFEDGEMALFGDKETDPASLSDGDASGNILFEKELLDSHNFGVVLVDDFVK